MDNVGVGPCDEVGCVLGFNLGPIVVVEKSILAGSCEVGGGAGIRWILPCVGIRHGEFAGVHKDSCISHAGVAWVGDGGGFCNAFIFKGADGMNVGAFGAGERGEGAKSILDFAKNEFFDCCHGVVGIGAKGGTILLGQGEGRGALYGGVG